MLFIEVLITMSREKELEEIERQKKLHLHKITFILSRTILLNTFCHRSHTPQTFQSKYMLQGKKQKRILTEIGKCLEKKNSFITYIEQKYTKSGEKLNLTNWHTNKLNKYSEGHVLRSNE